MLCRPFASGARGADRATKNRTGLGLAVAQQIAGLHGGRIAVESRVDQGSTLRIRLPCAYPAARA